MANHESRDEPEPRPMAARIPLAAFRRRLREWLRLDRPGAGRPSSAAADTPDAPSEASRDVYLRQVLENAPLILLVFDGDGMVTWHEGQGLSRLGLQSGELTGRHVSAGPAELGRRAQRVLHGETFVETIGLQGHTIDIHHAPLRDENGAIKGGMAMGVDRTEEYQAQERFRRVVDHASDAILLLDDDFRYTYLNDAACRLFGRSREALLGHTFRDFLYEEDAEALAGIRRTLRDEGIADHVLRMVRGDGTVVPLESRTVALGDGGYHCITRDMSPWLEAQEALRKSESYLRSLLGHSPVSLLATDADGIVRVYDGKDRPLFGVENPGTYIGRHYTTVPGRVSDFQPRMERVLAGEEFSTVIPVHGRTLRVQHSPIREADDEISGAVVVGFDITEERALEAQVRQAQRMEAVGNLAAGVSHDFNNLLTVVLANLDVARFREGDEAAAALGHAAEAAHSASELSRQLLDIGRANLSPRGPVALATAVREVLSLLDRSLADKIRTAAAVPNSLHIVGVRAQLRQVLLNLALNAAEAMPSGGAVRVTAEALTQPPVELGLPAREDGYVVVEVSDQGAGMDPEVVEHMWDPFFTTKGEDGTGLGNAVVWGIVREHGGSIAVDSTLGEGTTVRVYLPATAEEDVSPAPPNEPLRPPMIGPAAPPDVLVVDDLLPLRAATRRILEEAGYRVREAADGVEALTILDAAPIDLVVLDCSMPGMSGRQVYEHLQARDAPPRVLFVTGYTSDALEGLEPSPAWSLLPKPFDAASLLAASAAMLQGRAA